MNLIKFKTKQEFVYMTKTKLGETIICDGVMGIIVVDIDNDCYSNDYPKSDWGYLQTGFLIETQEFGLIHYPDCNNIILIKPNTNVKK